MEIIKLKAMELMKNCPGSHDWFHVIRVRDLALKLGRELNADLEVLEAAAYLHDIARCDSPENHEIKSAILAEKILSEAGFPEQKVKHVLSCIRKHRFRVYEEKSTIEEKILYDADKLDSIGAIGVARAFMYAGEMGYKLYGESDKEHSAFHEFKYKLCKVINTLNTEPARKIGFQRTTFMEKFFERLAREVKGEY